MIESQVSISKWADETFGECTVVRAVERVDKEVAELKDLVLEGYLTKQKHAKAIEECADIYITLVRVVNNLGGDLLEAVNHKMAINRKRKWKLDGLGCAQHIKEESNGNGR